VLLRVKHDGRLGVIFIGVAFTLNPCFFIAILLGILVLI